MTEPPEIPGSVSGKVPGKALLLLGCPEAPAQQAIALYIAHQLRTYGSDLLITGNPSVLNLLRVSDPAKH